MKFKFKEDVDPVSTGEPWYDLTDGGYIDPAKLLEDADQAELVDNAISTVRDFLDQAFKAGVLEES